MLGQSKPFASLSSTLLARKGQARPAMRPQGFGGFGAIPAPHDDLGWNDMGEPEGHGADAYAPPAIVPPVLRQREALQEEFEAPQVARWPESELGSHESEPTHEVVRDEPEAAQSPDPEAEPEPEFESASLLAIRVAKPVPAPVAVSAAVVARIGHEAQAKAGKAAFTLRLDHSRHLRLRLASALHNCSAQVLVTQALDSFLQSLPEVEELASQLPPRATR